MSRLSKDLKPRPEAERPAQRYARIWAVVRRIPKGCVATYGQVAFEAGLPRQARLAGYAMHEVPTGTRIPWYRVVNAQGRISLPPNSAGAREQKRRLEAEGVIFSGGRIDLARYRWQPRSAAPLLD